MISGNAVSLRLVDDNAERSDHSVDAVGDELLPKTLLDASVCRLPDAADQRMDAPASGHAVHRSAARHGPNDSVGTRPKHTSLQHSYAPTHGPNVSDPVVGRFRRVGQYSSQCTSFTASSNIQSSSLPSLFSSSGVITTGMGTGVHPTLCLIF